MTEKEIEDWYRHVSLLQEHIRDYNHYDAGLTFRQKEKYCQQRANIIRQIKSDLLGYPPFSEIVRGVSNSPFVFDECFDSMDWDMMQTIREIEERTP